MGSIVPSRLYQVKLFESYEVFRQSMDGWKREAELSDDILEHQIAKWVNKEKVLVVTTGPLNVIDCGSGMEPLPDDVPGKVMTRRERRTLAVIYAPAVDQGDTLYGEQPTGKKGRKATEVSSEPEPGDPLTARRISDANLVS